MADAHNDVDATVYKAIADTFSIPVETIGPQMVAADVDGWDSVSNSLLFLEIENRLAAELPIDKLIDCGNVGELCAAIKASLAAQGGLRKE